MLSNMQALTERFLVKVYPDSAGYCVSNDKRWGSQVVCLDIGVDSSLKVSISREDACSNKISLEQKKIVEKKSLSTLT